MAHEPDALLHACGVPREAAETAVELIAGARVGTWRGPGINAAPKRRVATCSDANLALALRWGGRPGAGLLPIRGHSNVQGVGSVGVAPALKTEFARRLGELYGVQLPSSPGLHTLASVEAAADGRIAAALLLGGNLFSATPDRAWTRTALQRIGTTIYVSTKLNESHVHGRGRTHLILPALARDEERQCTTQRACSTTSGSRRRATAARGDALQVEIIATLAQSVLPPGPLDWGELPITPPSGARSGVVPGYEPLAAIDQTRAEST